MMRIKNRIFSALAAAAGLMLFAGCGDVFEKVTVINGAVPVYQFTIPDGDSLGNYTKITAEFLVDRKNYRKQARVRAYGVYPAEYFSDLGDIMFLDFEIGSADKNGPYLLSNVIGTNRNIPIVSKNAGADTWFTLEFPLDGRQHPAYNPANYPGGSANGNLLFALGLGTGSATSDFTYYVKSVTLQNNDGSKKIVSKGSGFKKPAFAGYPENITAISRAVVSRVDPVTEDSQFEDPSGYYQVRKIYPWLYSIYDPDSVYCYLAVGEEKALLYDTAYGVGSLPGVIKKLTDKPVTVVLSHGHIDHANGAYQFDEAWLHADDFELAMEHTSSYYRESIIYGLAENGQVLPDNFDKDAYIQAGAGNIKELETGRIFDLGGLHMEVFIMEGHTLGSIGLLAREHRVLLNSDAANFGTWLFLPESLPLARYRSMLERTISLDFDTFFTGHSDAPMTKEDYQKILTVARNASPEKAVPWGNSNYAHLKPLVYQEGNVSLIFSEK